MFVDAIYLSLLYLEAILPALIGRRLNLGFSFSLNSLGFNTKHTKNLNIEGMTFDEEKSIIDKVFLLITDNWFFKWLKRSQKNPVAMQKKDKKPKVILNNDLSSVSVSGYNNNVSYTGQTQKRTIC